MLGFAAQDTDVTITDIQQLKQNITALGSFQEKTVFDDILRETFAAHSRKVKE